MDSRKDRTIEAIGKFWERAAKGKVKPPKSLNKKRVESPLGVPYEHDEQVALCKWLDRAGVHYFAVPNGAFLGNEYKGMAWLKNEGFKSGIPDIILVDMAPVDGLPICIEMKRRGGKGGGVLKDGTLTNKDQRRWQEIFPLKGWHHLVGLGARDAIEKLEALGIGKQ